MSASALRPHSDLEKTSPDVFSRSEGGWRRGGKVRESFFQVGGRSRTKRDVKSTLWERPFSTKIMLSYFSLFFFQLLPKLFPSFHKPWYPNYQCRQSKWDQIGLVSFCQLCHLQFYSSIVENTRSWISVDVYIRLSCRT